MFYFQFLRILLLDRFKVLFENGADHFHFRCVYWFSLLCILAPVPGISFFLNSSFLLRFGDFLGQFGEIFECWNCLIWGFSWNFCLSFDVVKRVYYFSFFFFWGFVSGFGAELKVWDFHCCSTIFYFLLWNEGFNGYYHQWGSCGIVGFFFNNTFINSFLESSIQVLLIFLFVLARVWKLILKWWFAY